MPHVVITGGNGYIGAALVSRALKQGWMVTSLERHPRPTTTPNLYRSAWRLGEALPDMAAAADAIIHVAHEWNTDNGEHDINVTGTMVLLDSAATPRGGRFVYVSSVSARQDALNAYGRLKWRVEQAVAARHGISARAGLVYGGPRRAQYGVLAKLSGYLLLPMIEPARLVQPIHLDELCDGLLTLAMLPAPSGSPYTLAARNPIAFEAFLRTLARALQRRPLVIMPIPARLALWISDLSRFLPGVPTIHRERILGLAGMRVVDSASSLSALGLSIADVQSKLSRDPISRHSQLVREGSTLLAYVLGTKPRMALVRRYVRAVNKTAEPAPLSLPLVTDYWPGALRYLEPLPNDGSTFRSRLDIAGYLAETCKAGTGQFFSYDGSRLGTFASAAATLILELVALPCRLLLQLHR